MSGNSVCVADASALVRATTAPPGSDAFTHLLSAMDSVVAPELIVPEVVSAFWKYHRFSGVDKTAALAGISGALALVDDFIPQLELAAEAFEIAAATRHPAYDAFYLALARRRSALLVTADTKLQAVAAGLGIRVQPTLK